MMRILTQARLGDRASVAGQPFAPVPLIGAAEGVEDARQSRDSLEVARCQCLGTAYDGRRDRVLPGRLGSGREAGRTIRMAAQDRRLGPYGGVPGSPHPGVPRPPDLVVDAHGEPLDGGTDVAAVEQVEGVEGGCPTRTGACGR